MSNQTLTLKLVIDGKEATATIDMVSDKLKKLPQGVKPAIDQASGAVNKMSLAVGQMGYVVNDAQMFMVNFRMGMMSIANNIPFVVGLIGDARRESQALGLSFKDVLAKSLAGPGGLLLAVNALMFALQFLPGLFQSASAGAKEHADEIKKLKDEYKKLTAEQVDNYLQRVYERMAELEVKNPVKVMKRESGTIGTVTTTFTSGKERFGGDWDAYQGLLNQKKVLQERQTNLGYVENISNRIAYNTQLINELVKDNKDAKLYWQNVIPDAKTFEEAKKRIEGWIEADRKLIEHNRTKGTDGTIGTKGANKRKLGSIKGVEGLEGAGFDLVDGRPAVPMTLSMVPEIDRGGWFDYESEFERERAELIRRWQEANPVTDALLTSSRSAVDGFFDDFVIKGESFAASWGNMWERMKNEALMSLWQLASNAVWDEIMSKLASGGGGTVGTGGTSGGGFGLVDVITSIIGLFAKPTTGTGRTGEVLAGRSVVGANVAKASMPVTINVGGELSVGLRELSFALKRSDITDRSFS